MARQNIETMTYRLENDNGAWLGNVTLTENGSYMSITDYGNFSFHWGSYGPGDFRDFICSLNVDYFGGKMYNSIAYIAYGKKYQESAMRYAEVILPALQKVLKQELKNE